MAVYKDEAKGTWRVIYRYTDWTGKPKQTQKRGFKTKEIAQKLNESGVAIRPTTLSKYLNEIEMEQLIKSASMRRRNDIRQSKKASPQHDIPVNTNDTPTTSESE